MIFTIEVTSGHDIESEVGFCIGMRSFFMS